MSHREPRLITSLSLAAPALLFRKEVMDGEAVAMPNGQPEQPRRVSRELPLGRRTLHAGHQIYIVCGA